MELSEQLEQLKQAQQKQREENVARCRAFLLAASQALEGGAVPYQVVQGITIAAEALLAEGGT